MKRIYFIVRREYNFRNAYQLFWTTKTGLHPNSHRKYNINDFLREYPTAEKITRDEAIKLAREERRRYKENPAFAGYADTYIYPYGLSDIAGYEYLYTNSTGIILETEPTI